MNIKQALKKKNKLVGEINANYTLLSTYNSVEVGVERPYDVRKAYEQWRKDTDELIELKTSIHTANQSMQGLIFRMSELKNLAKRLREVNCRSGKEPSNHYSRTPTEIFRETIISVQDRDAYLKEIEEEIDTIQDALDAFNAITKI